MNRELHEDDLVELGAVTVETRGGPVGTEDQERTSILALGWTDD